MFKMCGLLDWSRYRKQQLIWMLLRTAWYECKMRESEEECSCLHKLREPFRTVAIFFSLPHSHRRSKEDESLFSKVLLGVGGFNRPKSWNLLTPSKREDLQNEMNLIYSQMTLQVLKLSRLLFFWPVSCCCHGSYLSVESIYQVSWRSG